MTQLHTLLALALIVAGFYGAVTVALVAYYAGERSQAKRVEQREGVAGVHRSRHR